MGQLESKLNDAEHLASSMSSRSSISAAHIPNATTACPASPPPCDRGEPFPSQSPPSSPTGSKASSAVSSPKSSPSRSFFSFLQTPEKRLIEAAKRGDDEEVSVLLADGAHVNTRTTLKKETPLHKAAQYGNLSTSLLLLLNGADPCAVGKLFEHEESNQLPRSFALLCMPCRLLLQTKSLCSRYPFPFRFHRSHSKC